jgi:sensor histidine kinase YesM
MIGLVVIGLTAIVGLFTAISKPVNDNTKAMTVLTMQIEQLANELKEQNKKMEQHEKEFEEYKEHVRESQRRQWDEINKHAADIEETKHELELCKKNVINKGGNRT